MKKVYNQAVKASELARVLRMKEVCVGLKSGNWTFAVVHPVLVKVQ
jgi:hypothetical protein